MEETLLSQVSFSALDIHSASVIIILLAIGLTFFSTQQYCNTANWKGLDSMSACAGLQIISRLAPFKLTGQTYF